MFLIVNRDSVGEWFQTTAPAGALVNAGFENAAVVYFWADCDCWVILDITLVLNR